MIGERNGIHTRQSADPVREVALPVGRGLVAQLIQSTQANLAEVIVAENAPATDLRNSGVVVVAGAGRTSTDVAGLVSHGASRLLCVPPGGQLPRRVVIHCPSVAPHAETMGLVASLIRHINAEATFVSVLAENGQPVEYGQSLFAIRPAGKKK